MPDISDEELQAFAAKLGGKDANLSEEQRKKLREAFAKIVAAPQSGRVMVVQARPAAIDYAVRANDTSPEAMAQAKQLAAQQAGARVIPAVQMQAASVTQPRAEPPPQEGRLSFRIIPPEGEAAVDDAVAQAHEATSAQGQAVRQAIADQQAAVAARMRLGRAPSLGVVEPQSTVTAVPMIERFSGSK
jgi:hypothetical protein